MYWCADEFATPGQLVLAGDLECHLPNRSLHDCVDSFAPAHLKLVRDRSSLAATLAALPPMSLFPPLGFAHLCRSIPLAPLIRSLQIIQAFGLPTALVRNWSSLFLNRTLNVVSEAEVVA